MGKQQSKLNSEVMEDLRSITQFNDEEIIEGYKDFLKDCPEGVLTKDKFKSMYANLFRSGDASIFAENVFKTFDTNADGSIDFREFLCVISISYKGKIEERLERVFNMYDLDRDGFVTKEEMVGILKSIYKMVGMVLKMPKDEATPEKRMEKIFRQMDGDRDGRLSLEEFVKGAKSDPTLCKFFQDLLTKPYVTDWIEWLMCDWV